MPSCSKKHGNGSSKRTSDQSSRNQQSFKGKERANSQRPPADDTAEEDSKEENGDIDEDDDDEEEEADGTLGGYKKRPAAFFKQGRVVDMVWAEPCNAGLSVSTGPVIKNHHVAIGHHGQKTFSKQRRLIVLRAFEKHCVAIGIFSHGKKGAKGEVWQHGIVYTTPFPAQPQKHEMIRGSSLQPVAIRVFPDLRDDKFDDVSRVHYGKPYTVEYNVDVRSFGVVHRDSLEPLIRQYNAVQAIPPQNPQAGPSTARQGSQTQPIQAGPSSQRRGSYLQQASLPYRGGTDASDQANEEVKTKLRQTALAIQQQRSELSIKQAMAIVLSAYKSAQSQSGSSMEQALVTTLGAYLQTATSAGGEELEHEEE